jgi:hypothetical protein
MCVCFQQNKECVVKNIMGIGYKKEKEASLYLEAKPNPSYSTLVILMVEINPRIAILPLYLNIFALGFVLIFFHVLFCFCLRCHSPNPRRHNPSPRRHGSSQQALTSLLNDHIVCKRMNLPNPRVPLDS